MLQQNNSRMSGLITRYLLLLSKAVPSATFAPLVRNILSYAQDFVVRYTKTGQATKFILLIGQYIICSWCD
jgi:hypothetical protein